MLVEWNERRKVDDDRGKTLKITLKIVQCRRLEEMSTLQLSKYLSMAREMAVGWIDEEG